MKYKCCGKKGGVSRRSKKHSLGKISVLLCFDLDCSLFWFDLGDSRWQEDHGKQEHKVPSLGDEQSNLCIAREQGNFIPGALMEDLSGKKKMKSPIVK